MKNILLGVTASVAAVKTVNLAKALGAFGNVSIVTTKQAAYFLKPDYDALQELGISVYKDDDEWPLLHGHYPVGDPILHIELRRSADCMVIAPLDANTLAKIAYGLCDNLLTSVVRAWDWQKPLFLCPAMNTLMWENPPTAEHVMLLKNRGALFIDPIEKKLACNDIGMGGMAEVADIAESMSNYFTRSNTRAK